MEQQVILLRPWREEDIPALAHNANSPQVAAGLRDGFPVPYTLEDAQWFIVHTLTHPDERERLFAIDLGGTAIGAISYQISNSQRTRYAEIGYWLGAEYWGKGYGTQAVAAVCRLAFTDPLVEHIAAEVYGENTASRKLLEGLGFLLEHFLERCTLKDGVYRDTCLYCLPRSRYERWEA